MRKKIKIPDGWGLSGSRDQDGPHPPSNELEYWKTIATGDPVTTGEVRDQDTRDPGGLTD